MVARPTEEQGQGSFAVSQPTKAARGVGKRICSNGRVVCTNLHVIMARLALDCAEQRRGDYDCAAVAAGKSTTGPEGFKDELVCKGAAAQGVVLVYGSFPLFLWSEEEDGDG